MRARSLVSSVLFLVALGCRADRAEDAETVAAAGGCDQAELKQLAEQLSRLEPEHQVEAVAVGLSSACRSILPKTTEAILVDAAVPDQRDAGLPGDDAALTAAKARLCADGDALTEKLRAAQTADYGAVVYETCGLDRFELMTLEEARAFRGAGWLTWTTHQILLDQGTPLPVAKAISRALMELERARLGPILIQPLPGQSLAKVHAKAELPEGVVVYVSMGEIELGEQRIATLERGELDASDVEAHRIVALHDALSETWERDGEVAEQRGESASERLLLVFDHRVPFSTVVDVLYTGGRAGYSTYSLIVEAAPGVRRAIHVAPPRYDPQTAVVPKFKTFVTRDGFRVIYSDVDETLPKTDPDGDAADAWDHAELAERVGEALDGYSGLKTAVVSAENDIPIGVILATYSTLLGPDCQQTKRERCLLPLLQIEAGAG